jgi:hypothetical protein
MFSSPQSENRPEPENLAAPSSRSRRLRKVLVWTAAPLCAVGTVVGLVWSMTEPLVPNTSTARPLSTSSPTPPPAVPAQNRPEWPRTALSGPPAKKLLLELLELADQRLRTVDDYTATFRKQERVRGKLHPLQTIAMKVRNEPFAVYLKFLAPKKGKEVLFGIGLHDGKVIAHNGDWTRRLIPRLAVAPTDPIALADTRHPITDAGIVSLTRRLIAFRKLDLTDTDAETVLDFIEDDQGRRRPRSIHTHTVQNAERPFIRVEVLYDPATFIPCKITSYDWPAPGEADEPLNLAESYEYDDLDLNANLNDRDFDLTNPDYEFTRF